MKHDKALNTIIARSGLNKMQLAKALGRSENYIYNYSVRGNIPRLDTFTAIADCSGYDVIARNRESGEEIFIDPPDKQA